MRHLFIVSAGVAGLGLLPRLLTTLHEVGEAALLARKHNGVVIPWPAA